MKILKVLLPFLAAGTAAWAFPPAPSYSVFGTIRDEGGRPLDTGDGLVIVNGTSAEITRSPTDTSRGRGVNYEVRMPMDGNTTPQLFQVSALRPQLPFTIRVVMNNKSYLPIQMVGKTWLAGQPAERTRLDLTLGVDSDGDGLPDSWEQALIDSDASGQLTGLSNVNPGDDLDQDGLTNLQEYQLGTYALDRLDGLDLKIAGMKDGKDRLEFPVVAGRTYRIKSSPTLAGWLDEPFAPGGTETVQSYFRAPETTLMTVYVPILDRAKLLFRLYAE